jgi:DNA-binding transcriptional MocR family regulator
MDFRLNVPPQPPELQEKLASAIESVLRRADFLERLTYGSTAGRPEDREAAAHWLRPRLSTVTADDIVICAGSASLLVALVTTFAKPGDVIVTEALTYPGIRAVARHFGMTLAGVPTDQQGIIPAALAEACERLRPRILYCTPTIQNPTTATMSAARRSEIARVAQAFDLTILEDDAYGMLPSAAPPPIAALAPERTFYLASLSKCVSPGLRIAYGVGPEGRRAEMTEGVRVVTFLASQLIAGVATQLIMEGSAQAILEAIRSESVARQAIAARILEGHEIAAHPEGPHLWLPLRGEWRIPELGSYLRENGVTAKGDGFAVDGQDPNALRVGLGTPSSQDELTIRLEFLSNALRDERLRVS